jgi:hypothetical protein
MNLILRIIKRLGPDSGRAQKQEIANLKSIARVLPVLCEQLINVEQPKPGSRCSYCNRIAHEPLCPVGIARDIQKLLR